MARMAQREATIVSDDDIRGGEPVVAGTRVTVRRIQALVEEQGLPAQEVADRLDLEVGAVYEALAYYHNHPDEMTELAARREKAIERSREAGATRRDDLGDG